jgi:hypothetical protein
MAELDVWGWTPQRTVMASSEGTWRRPGAFG